MNCIQRYYYRSFIFGLFISKDKNKWRKYFGQLLLRIPYLRQKYYESFLKIGLETKAKSWEEFGDTITEIPENGWSLIELKNFVDNLVKKTNTPLMNTNFSGTIYPPTITSSIPSVFTKKIKDLSLPEKLNMIYTYSFRSSYLWNSLHGNEFNIGGYLEYCVVKMVANLYGDNKKTMGFVTSGGTESIMTAMRSYRDWGVRNKGIGKHKTVIIAPNTVHASVMKAGIAYNIEIVLVDTDEYGNVDLRQLEKLSLHYSKNLVAIVGSTPSYSNGTIDPIDKMAKIALVNNCGLHVDCCLGGFVIEDNFLDIPGVTSMSVDTHKNGLAPKGSSVLITKEINDYILHTVNLAYFSFYTIPEWSGGLYGTPTDKGSQSCVPALHAMLAMLAIGKRKYREISNEIHMTTYQIKNILNVYTYVKCRTKNCYNVVAFSLNEQFQKGAIYSLANNMEKRGWVLNALSNGMLHVCITARTIGKAEDFEKAFLESFLELGEINEKVKNGEIQFSGNGGLYGALTDALVPKKEEMTWTKYIENWLFGIMGANDGINAYFLNRLDPNYFIF